MDPDALALVARQPVYDSAMTVIAYELLYRESLTAVKAGVFDPRQATLRVIANAALEIGLDRLAGDLPVHINFPRELLITEALLPLQPERVVIEVLEDVPAEPAVLAGIRRLRARGHRIALDDYSPRRSDRALLDVADIVKLCIAQVVGDELTRTVREMKDRGLKLIAEEVETVEQFEHCIALGFDGFQGYFLQQPQTFKAQRAPASKIGALRVIATISEEETSIVEVEKVLSQDVALSYRVLRCINSSYYNLPRKVDSIRQAVVILGLDNLRQLCTLVSLQGFDDRPPILFVNMMTRARMCEQLGKLAGQQQTGAFFITGLFSMLNVLTGMPTAQILEALPLSPPVTAALLAEEGELGAALKCVRAYERGRWEQVVFAKLPQNVIRAAYVDAVFWAEQTRTMLTA